MNFFLFFSYVVGIRFAKANGVIYLQLKTGKISEFGNNMINASTSYWLEPPSDIRTNVLTITKSKRSMFLDDIYFTDDTILTGVQFYMEKGTIRTSIYGRNGFQESRNISSQYAPLINMKSMRDNMGGLHADSLTYTKTLNQTVQFERSSFKYDMGQSLVPSFGTSEITTDPPQILQGIGFIHVTNHDTFGGVIIPFVRTINSYKLSVNVTNF